MLGGFMTLCPVNSPINAISIYWKIYWAEGIVNSVNISFFFVNSVNIFLIFFNILNKLIDEGANLNKKSNIDSSPVYIASYNGQAEIVEAPVLYIYII